MGASFQVLRICNHERTLSADLLGSSYALVENGWSIGIARERTNALGGLGPYEDVVEELTIDIMGASDAAIIANIDTLRKLLSTAWNFEHDEQHASEAIFLEVQLSGGTLLRARIREGQLFLPTSFNDRLVVNEIASAIVRIRRSGVWYETTSTTSSTSTAAANPAVQSVVITGSTDATTGANALSVKLSGMTADSNGGVRDGNAAINAYLAVVDNAGLIQIKEGEACTGTEMSVVADSGSRASGGSILRWTPGSLYQQNSIAYFDVASNLQSERRIDVFVAFRQSSTAQQYQVYAETALGTTGAVGNLVQTPWKAIPPSTTPQILHVGSIMSNNGHKLFRLRLKASATGGTLDIDYICLVGTGRETSSIVALTGGQFGRPFSANAAIDVQVYNDPLRERRPLFALTAGSWIGVPYAGNIWLRETSGQAATVWLATDGTYWTFQNVAKTATQQFTLSASRIRGYLTPQ